MRSVQLPTATEDRLASALELNANAFILGRTPPWRVGWALLARERGDGIRTGIVAEWPEDDRHSQLPGGLRESANVSFSPAVAALAALSAHCDDPMAAVDASTGTVTVCVPTSKGLLARSIRTSAEGSSIDRGDVARAVGEACVSAGTPPQEAADAVRRSNVDLTGGSVKGKKEELLLRSRNKNYSAEGLRDIVVKTTPAGGVVRLHQVAEIRDRWADNPNRSFLNGKPSVVVTVQNTLEEDLLDITDKVRQYIDDFNSRHEAVEVVSRFLES